MKYGMYDKNGLLKPEYIMTESEQKKIKYNETEEIADKLTEKGKGTNNYFITCDGKKCDTIEEVMEYNQMYYENMKKQKDDYTSESGEKHR